VKYLVYCTCGHNLERHGPEGCGGADGIRSGKCGCAFDQRDALDAAIAEARAHPWGKEVAAAGR